MSRLSFAGSHQDADDAEELLTREARNFIDDWHLEARPERTDCATL